MIVLTRNEKRVLRLLMAAFDRDYSINQIAKECNLAPNGALKILKKFEREGILLVKDIANIRSYKIDFNNEKTLLVLELATIPELESRIKHRFDDLQELKEVTKACILFGSYIDLNKKPHDLDVLFILKDYKEYKKKLNEAKDIIPVKVHDVVQTESDLRVNLSKKDKVVLDILKTGIVLWGHKLIIKVIKGVCARKA